MVVFYFSVVKIQEEFEWTPLELVPTAQQVRLLRLVLGIESGVYLCRRRVKVKRSNFSPAALRTPS